MRLQKQLSGYSDEEIIGKIVGFYKVTIATKKADISFAKR
jgi:hypothetical protein